MSDHENRTHAHLALVNHLIKTEWLSRKIERALDILIAIFMCACQHRLPWSAEGGKLRDEDTGVRQTGAGY
jgi:hypothetical protein